MDTACAIIAEGLVFLLMNLVTAEIIGRHFLGKPIPGHYEVATLLLILILYFGVAYTQLERGHIRVELLTSKLNVRKQELLELITLFLSLIVSLLMFWATVKRAKISVSEREFISGIINFPIWPSKCGVAFGFGLLSVTIIIQICNYILKIKRHG